LLLDRRVLFDWKTVSRIEFNKQREKTPSQVYNESNTLQHIYSERAKLRQADAGKLYGNHPVPEQHLASLPKADEKIHTREKLSETLGIPQKKLETIMEVGKLAETGLDDIHSLAIIAKRNPSGKLTGRV